MPLDQATPVAVRTPAGGSRWRAGRALGRVIQPRRELTPLEFGVLIGLGAFGVGLISHGNGYFQWTFAIIDGILAFGVGMALNWAGVPAFGMGMFYAAGGYWTALMRDHDISPLLLLFGGAAIGLIGAYILASFTMSLGFHSFAMLSLVISQAGYQVIFSTDKLGKENGLYGVDRGRVLGISLDQDLNFLYYCGAILVILTVLGRVFYQSSTGRALRAGRDDLVKTESLGVNVRRLKTIAFAMGGATASIAGVLYAQLQGVVDPSMADWSQSASAVMMVVLGGLGTFYGSVLGGVVFGWITLRVTSLSQEPLFWIGLIFVLVVLLTPGGVAALLRRGIQLARRWLPSTRRTP